MDLRWCAFLSSLTLPEAASSALEGTQPRFTQVPPMSCPSTMPTLRPCKWCGDACQASVPKILQAQEWVRGAVVLSYSSIGNAKDLM